MLGSTAPQTYSQDDTLALISERAKVLTESGQPALFEVNLNRRTQQGVNQTIASLSAATLEQINDPMRWVPMLCGGGEYIINVRHPSVTGRIGGPLGFNAPTDGPGMQPHPPNPLVTLRPDWQGPKLNTPAMPEQQVVAPNGGPVTPAGVAFANGYGTPPAPVAISDRERELSQQLADLKAQNARIETEAKARAEMEAVKRDADQRIRDAEKRAEDRQRESDTRMRDLEAKLNTVLATPPRPPETNPIEKIIPLIASLVMPLIERMLTSQHETRQLMLRQNEEQNRRQIEANEKQYAMQLEMIRAQANKPGMSDEMKLLITTLQSQASQNGGEGQAMMMTRMVEAMGMVSKTSMSMIETTVDALGGDPEHPAVIAIREGAAALKTIMAGSREGAMRSIPKKQLQPGQQQLTLAQQQQLAQQRAKVQTQQAQAAAQQRAQAAAGRQPQPAQQQPPPPKPANTVHVSTPPVPAPVPAPVVVVAPAAAVTPATVVSPNTPAVQVVHFEPGPTAIATDPLPAVLPPVIEVAPPPEEEGAPPLTHFQVLRAGIEALKPPEQVATYFIDLVLHDDPSLEAELDKHGGQPYELLLGEFGQVFINANSAYFKQLGELIDEKGTEAKLWGEDEPENDAAEEAPAPEEPFPDATAPLDAGVVPALALVPSPQS